MLRDRSVKFCENMNIYQVMEGSVAKLQLTACYLSKMLCCNGLSFCGLTRRGSSWLQVGTSREER